MKKFIIILLAFHVSTCLCAQDLNVMMNDAMRIESIPDESAALLKYQEILKIQPNNVAALNRSSELCSRIGQRQQNGAARDQYYKWAIGYAKEALTIDPRSSEANASIAIALGRSSMTKSGKDKITIAKEIRKYVDAAINLDETNFKAWHVLGRWHYEISHLNMVERTMIKVIYGGLPEASLNHSIFAFEKARVLAPGFVLNYFEMAKAYKSYGAVNKAKAYLNYMLTLPDATEDDPNIKQMGRKFLQDWN